MAHEGRLNLRWNTVYGGLGFLLPTVVVFLAYPVVLRHLGASAMGVYILAVSLSGTFAFLEFGLTTVTTKLVAEAVAAGQPRRASDAVATSLAFYVALGLIGCLALWLAAPALARWVAADDPRTATRVFRIAGVLLVSSYVNNVSGSALKGLHRFDWATGQSTLLSIANWGGALVAVLLGGRVVAVAAAALVANALVAAASVWATSAMCRDTGIRLAEGRPTLDTLRPMLRFGAFMSLNGVAGLLANQVQSFVIARLFTPAAIAVWGTAVQIVSKVNALSGAAFEVLLPVSAQLLEPSARTPARVTMLRSIYMKALGLSLLGSIGASIVLYFAAPALIHFWLRSPIDDEVVSVLRILCIGMALNGATPVAYHLLNGVGRPGVNSAFMLIGTAILYATLLALVPGGLSVERFAIATTVSFLVNGFLYFGFCEAIVWRRWLLARGQGFRPTNV